MPRPCSICSHPARNEIDKHLLNMPLSMESYRTISGQFKVSRQALERHRKAHIQEDVDVLASMQQAREESLREIHAQELEKVKENAATTISGRLEQARDVFEQLKILRDRAGSLLDQAETSEDLRSAGVFLRELREQLKFLAELEGKIQTQPQVNILFDPEWIRLKSIIVTVLKDYPAAMEALRNALPRD